MVAKIHNLDAMLEHIDETLKQMQQKVEYGETWLRETKRWYKMQTKICDHCMRVLPVEAKQCRPCRNEDLAQKYCTMETRIADYFEILRKCDLWPLTGPFQSCSVSAIISRVADIKRNLKHDCALASQCPLHLVVDVLNNAVQGIKEEVIGLCLQCAREGEWNAKLCKHKI
jgi:ribosomal protein L40E